MYEVKGLAEAGPRVPRTDCAYVSNASILLDQRRVELVETAPRAALDEADKDATHRLGVNPLVAVEDEHLSV